MIRLISFFLCVRCNTVVCILFSAVFLRPFPVLTQEQEQPLQWCAKAGSVHTRRRKGSLLCRRVLTGALPAGEGEGENTDLDLDSSPHSCVCLCLFKGSVHHYIAFTQRNHNIVILSKLPQLFCLLVAFS